MLDPADCREFGLEASAGVRGEAFPKYVLRGGRFGGREVFRTGEALGDAAKPLNISFEVGLDGSAEPRDVPFDVGLEGSADPLSDVLDEGNIGSAELL